MDTQDEIAVPQKPIALHSGAGKGSWVFSAILIWALAISVASLTGVLRQLPAMAIGALIIGWFVMISIASFRSSALRRVADRAGIRGITAFQVWRVAAALLFFWYGAQGLLPGEFVARAGWGDLIAGVASGIVWLWPTRGGYWLVHLFGLADLILATATGMHLRLSGPAEMRNIASFPVVLIPLFGVGLTAATHLVAFHLLTRGRR